MNVSLRLGVCLGCVILAVGGCLSTPNLRMSALLGMPGNTKLIALPSVEKWPNQHRFAFMIFSDASGPEAAPARHHRNWTIWPHLVSHSTWITSFQARYRRVLGPGPPQTGRK